MNRLLAKKKRLLEKFEKKPNGGLERQTGESESGRSGNVEQSPLSAQPSVIDTSSSAAVAPNHSTNSWIRAFDIFQDKEPDLAADYKRHLASLQGSKAPRVDFSNHRSVESVVEQLSKSRVDKQWQVSILGNNIKLPAQAEKLVKFLLWTDPIVQNAVRTQPHAALAWSGVSLLLPLLTQGTTQNEDMLKGFTLICEVQLYCDMCEDSYLRSEYQNDYQGLHEPLAKLYSNIIEYQARVICHLSKAQLSRAWENVTGSNDWDEMTKEIERLRNSFADLVSPLKEEEIRKHWKRQLQEIQESRDIQDGIHRVLEDSGRQTLRMHEEQKEKDLLGDLSATDFASDYKGDKNFNPQRVTGTCEWFFNDDRFRKWRDDSDSRILWVTAGPGCGKSVLSRALIDEGRLSTNVTTSVICYFFFKDGDARRMHSTNALCALLHQLLTQDSIGSLIKIALTSHKNYGKCLTQNFSELWQILVECARSQDIGDVVCILDALDECDSNSRRRLIDQLKDTSWHGCTPKLKFLITSRPYYDLEVSFEKLSDAALYLRFDGDDDEKSKQIGEEINLVIDDRVQAITRGFTDDDRHRISECLKRMKNRTYLWLSLTFDAIEESGSQRRSDVESLLACLSEEISDRYEKILSRSKNPVQTETLLQIILAAERPLTVDEANIALTIALRGEKFTSNDALQSELWPRENFAGVIKSLCSLCQPI